MTKIATTPFDAAKYIRTPEAVIELLNDAFESGHVEYIANALGIAARSEGMTKLAKKSGVNRQALYTALSKDGNPTLETLLKVLSALGIKLKCEADLARADAHAVGLPMGSASVITPVRSHHSKSPRSAILPGSSCPKSCSRGCGRGLGTRCLSVKHPMGCGCRRMIPISEKR